MQSYNTKNLLNSSIFKVLAIIIAALALVLIPLTTQAVPQSTVFWESHAAPENNGWEGMTWSSELGIFVAVSSTGTNRAMTSPDGENWTAHATPNGNWRDIAWSPELGLFVAVSAGGTAAVMTSPDGENWTAQTAPNGPIWWGVTWSPELGVFVATATSGFGTDRTMISSDGIAWTSNPASDNAATWRDIAWSPELGLFAAIGFSGVNERIMTSPDGENWTGQESPTLASHSITWSSELGIFVAVGNSGAVLTSSDGINWTTQTAAENNNWWDVTWSPELGLFVAVANNGTSRVMTSSDGVNWTGSPAPQDNGWFSVAWSPELGVFAGTAASGAGPNWTMVSNILTVETTEASGVTKNAATLNGELLSMNGITDVEVSFRYRVANSTDPYIETPRQAASTLGSFMQEVNDLQPNTTYEYEIIGWYGTDSQLLGDTVLFTTPSEESNSGDGGTGAGENGNGSAGESDEQLAETGQNIMAYTTLASLTTMGAALLLMKRCLLKRNH